MVKFRCTPAEKMRLDELARRRGTDVSDYLRRRAFEGTDSEGGVAVAVPVGVSREQEVERRARELEESGLPAAAARRLAAEEIDV
jgi:hypothetical protein